MDPFSDLYTSLTRIEASLKRLCGGAYGDLPPEVRAEHEQMLHHTHHLLQLARIDAASRPLRRGPAQKRARTRNRLPDLPPPSAFEARVREVVAAHLHDATFSVHRLATLLALSRQQLFRRLRAETGRTPVQYIRYTRIEQAARLLRERRGNISEVAYAVGFSSLAYFTQCFREHFGVTPTVYREQHPPATP